MPEDPPEPVIVLHPNIPPFQVNAFVALLQLVKLNPLIVEPERFVANKFVVVAAVPVAFIKVKFCKVLEPFTIKLTKLAVLPKILFEKKLVEVAFVVVESKLSVFKKVKFPNDACSA